MIRKGKLYRECRGCEKKFEPSGLRQHYCKRCQKKGIIKGNLKRIKSLRKYQKRHLDFLSRIRNSGSMGL